MSAMCAASASMRLNRVVVTASATCWARIAVVDGLTQCVDCRGRREVALEDEVHDEVLAVAALLLEDAVASAGTHTLDLDPIHQRSRLRRL